MSLQWLYNDSIFMKEAGRKRGCLCLLLCLIDGLAKQESPGSRGNKERYCRYLKRKLSELGIDKSIRIEEKDDLVHISELIYEYFRCYFVHEGDSRENEHYEIQIEYEESGRFRFNSGILMDRPREQIIVKADWLIDLLDHICESEFRA